MAYSDKVIDHYENPRNVGNLDKDSVNVGTGAIDIWLHLEREDWPARKDELVGHVRRNFEASEALLKLSLDDQELRVATAELAALAGRPDRARALAEEAGRAIGETAEIYRVLALAHLENGEPGHALKQAQRALELDANDEKVKALISALKNRSPRRAGTGSRPGSGGSGGQG